MSVHSLSAPDSNKWLIASYTKEDWLNAEPLFLKLTSGLIKRNQISLRYNDSLWYYPSKTTIVCLDCWHEIRIYLIDFHIHNLHFLQILKSVLNYLFSTIFLSELWISWDTDMPSVFLCYNKNTCYLFLLFCPRNNPKLHKRDGMCFLTRLQMFLLDVLG